MFEETIILEAEKLASKFVKKVETGMARSKETYAECRYLLELIKEYRIQKGYENNQESRKEYKENLNVEIANSLSYTKEIPTEPGYYWMKWNGQEVIQYVFKPLKVDKLCIQQNSVGHGPISIIVQRCIDLEWAEWAGPIKEPTPVIVLDSMTQVIDQMEKDKND